MKISSIIFLGASVVLLLSTFASYKIYFKQINLKEDILEQLNELEEKFISEPSVGVKEIDVAKGEISADFQEKIVNTVVQVFSQNAYINLFQPYKTPIQSAARGSGFLINNEGEIVTNAHVVAQARSVWVQIPYFGKKIIEVDVLGVSFDRDLALLKLKPEFLELVKNQLGKIPYLELGDSDKITRAQEVMALGYPLGMESLKNTNGVISGIKDEVDVMGDKNESFKLFNLIETSAAINPGNSGGPLVDMNAKVIGINSAGNLSAQNIGIAIPVNILKTILPDLRKNKLLRKPFFGIRGNYSDDTLAETLGNPIPSGFYLSKVYKGGLFYENGVRDGDMLYEIDGYKVDCFGEIDVEGLEDRISINNYTLRLPLGKDVRLVVYRNGERKTINMKITLTEFPIRKVFSEYEKIDYEVIAGLVVMPLTLNHIYILKDFNPLLVNYVNPENWLEPALVITHVLPDSLASRSRCLDRGLIIKEVNDVEVKTLQDFRFALSKNLDKLKIKTEDNIIVVFPLKKVLQDEKRLSKEIRYPISNTIKKLMEKKLALGKE